MEQTEFQVQLTFVTDQPFTVAHFPRVGAKGYGLLDVLGKIAQVVQEGGGSVTVSKIARYLADEQQEMYGWVFYEKEGEIPVPSTVLGLATPMVEIMFESGETAVGYQDNLNRWRTVRGRALAEKVVYWRKIDGIIYDPPQQAYEKVARNNKEKQGEGDQ